MANGTGPNPYLSQLQAATNQNNQNAAGFIGSQKGLNPALAARLAGQQMGQNNQSAANAASGLEAQQQLGAMGALGQLSLGQQGVTQQGITGANAANAGIANTNAQAQGQILGGALGGAGVGLGLLGKAHGGMIHPAAHYALGGSVMGPQSFVGNYLNPQASNDPLNPMPNFNQPNALAQGSQALGKGIANLFSRGPQAAPQSQWGNTSADYKNLGTGNSIADYTSLPDAGAPAPQFTAEQAAGGAPMAENMAPTGMMAAKDGGSVPGKATVKGDSPKNDTVPAVLSPGEIVIPRHILQSKNPALAAAHFVEQEMAKQPQKKSNYDDGGGVANPQADILAHPDPSIASQLVDYVKNKPLDAYSQAIADRDANAAANNSPATPDNSAAPNLNIAANARSPAPASLPAASPSLQNSALSDPLGYEQYAKNLQNAFGLAGKGLEQEATAQGNLDKAQADIESQKQQSLQTLQNNYQKNYDGIMDQRDKFVQDIQNSHIDPNRYLSNMGTGQKVSTAIGLILGGIGGGLTHQANPALGFLNQQIDNDIKGQTSELGKKENLLSANFKQLGDLTQATQMTKLNMLDGFASQLQSAADKAQDPIVKARALQAKAALLEKAAPLQQQIAQNRAIAQSGQPTGDRSIASGGTSQAYQISLEMDPARARRIETNGQVFHAPSDASAEKLRPQLEALDEYDSALKNIENFNTKNGTTYTNKTKQGGQAQALNSQMDVALTKVETAGGQIGRVLDKLREQAPDAGAFFQNSAQGKLGAAKSLSANTRAALLKGLSTGPAFSK